MDYSPKSRRELLDKQKGHVAERCPKNQEICPKRPNHGLKRTIKALAGSIRLRVVRASPNVMDRELI